MYIVYSHSFNRLMLKHEDVLALKYRTKLVIDNLKNCHSGTDIHEVGNMLHTAQAILEVLDEDRDCEDLIKPMIERVEKQQVEFFKKKYGGWKPRLT